MVMSTWDSDSGSVTYNESSTADVGGTTIGADFVAKSAPDGHTLVMMLSAHAINATLMPKLPYDTVASFFFA